MIRIGHLPVLALSLLAILVGCGGGGADKPSSAVGGTINAPAGSTLSPLLPMTIRLINQSSKVNTADFAKWSGWIQWQLATDFNRRWETQASVEVYTGSIDDSIPTVVLQDGSDDTAAGATYLTPDGMVWRVLALPHTMAALPAYLSHAVVNRARPDYLPGQSVEAWDYGYLDYSGRPELADFDFPNAHGLQGSYLGHNGMPAKDLLNVLP